MNDKIQLKRGTLANWLNADPILLDGEMALVATNPATPNVYDQYKVGGGSKKFSELPYQGLPCLQELGDSTTSPLSQKAITDYVGELKIDVASDVSILPIEPKKVLKGYFINSDGKTLDGSSAFTVKVTPCTGLEKVILKGYFVNPIAKSVLCYGFYQQDTFGGTSLVTLGTELPSGYSGYLRIELDVPEGANYLSVTTSTGYPSIVGENLTTAMSSLEEGAQATSESLSMVERNINGTFAPIVTKTATTTFVDFERDENFVAGQKLLFYIPSRKGLSQTAQIRTSTSAIGEYSLAVSEEGFCEWTVSPNTDYTLLRIHGLLIGDKVTMGCSERTLGYQVNEHSQKLSEHSQKLSEHSQKLSEHSQKLSEHSDDIEYLRGNIGGKDVKAITETAAANSVDFPVDGNIIRINTPVTFYSLENAGVSVTIQQRDATTAYGEVITAFDDSGYLTATVVNLKATLVRIVRVKKGSKVSLVSSVGTVGKRISALEGKFNHVIQNEELTGATLRKGNSYYKCVFRGETRIENNVEVIECDFVNSPLLSGTNSTAIENCRIVRNNFIGANSRMHIGGLYNCDILSNDFPISSDRYPEASPKTKGETSRNIFTYVMNNCRVIGNHIHIGRTGLCILGNRDRLTAGLLPSFSSCDNIIANNMVEGIGEEHISFDGAPMFDLGTIEDVNVTYTEVDTGQMQDGNAEANQTKIVARVSLSMVSNYLGVSPFTDGKHIKGYSSMDSTHGLYGVNKRNSKYYKLVGFELKGNVLTDETDGLPYSADGKYQVTLELPTRYTYKTKGITAEQETACTAVILQDWAVGDEVYVGGIQSKNVICNNVIEGIGTDTISDIEDMGGIVLYGICLHNTVNNNILRQKRIWLQSWAVKKGSGSYLSKLKMQSFNTISNNTLLDTCISLLNITGEAFSKIRVNRGNRIVGNTVSGTDDVAGIMVDNCEDTTLVGNTSRHYRIRNCNGLKLIGNTSEVKESGVSGSFFYANENVLSDVTDEVAPKS